MKQKVLTHQFVEYIPENPQQGVLYVSIAYTTAVHRCCCGCGEEVVTPLSPTDWQVIFDGETVSLYPSIGNWSFKCQSHYWIKNNRVRWAEQWSQQRIDSGRTHDRLAKSKYYEKNNSVALGKVPSVQIEQDKENQESQPTKSLWSKWKSWWS